ncbi:MAG: tryptophan 7-halogenase, partial [Pseudomonadota bacterium]
PDSVPDRLLELLELWRYRPPSHRDFPQIEEIFPGASYQYVLYGMGFRPSDDAPVRRADDPDAAMQCFQTTARTTRQYLSGLPAHRQLIETIREQGLPAAQAAPQL